MQIVFVDNLLIDGSSWSRKVDMQPHLGLLSLIATAEGAGHDCRLYNPKLAVAGGLRLDETLYEALADEILQLSPQVVGFTALGCNFICVLQVATCIKRRDATIPILLGGPHATILHREILERFPQFDVIARHESESAIAPLLDGLIRGTLADIPGLSFREGDRLTINPPGDLIADLDSLPFPAFSHHPIRTLGLKALRVEAGRGCPFSCTFCSTASFFGRKYRVKSPARLLKEFDFLNRECGISHFDLTHDLFTVDKRSVYAFCEAVSGMEYTWSCSARMDCVDKDLLKRMSESGCRAIYFGVETGSPRMQRISQKHLDIELFGPTIEVTQQFGIDATVSFITGYPEELPIDQNQTLDLIGSCFKRSQATLQVQLHLLTPEPGTKLTAEYSDRLEYDGHVSDFNAPTLGADDSKVISANPAIFLNHHFYPGLVPRRRHIFITSIYQVVYGLGFLILRQILGQYDERLSCFLEEIDEWAIRCGRELVNGQLVVDYMTDSWGAQHYLTSLVRFAIAGQQLRTGIARDGWRGRRPLRPRRSAAYRMTRVAAVLTNIHDCPTLLGLLQRKEHLTECVLRELGHYLIYLDDPSGEDLRTFMIQEGVVDLLAFLEERRSYSECQHYFVSHYGQEKELRDLFGRLVAEGILETLVGVEAPDLSFIGNEAISRVVAIPTVL